MAGRFICLHDVRRQDAGVLVAMSGGVDSSVAALLLQGSGFRVVGITMKNYCYAGAPAPDRSCCSLEAVDDARRECGRLRVSHRVADVEDFFTREVIADFLSEYENARTPNPCVRCNTIVRFRTLMDHADRLGLRFVATGHYARIFESKDGRRLLARSVDRNKDQSYFLSGIQNSVLPRIIFPLGEHTKEKVREFAREASMTVAHKPESQEVCFVPEGTLKSFLESKGVSFVPGWIENTRGEVIGEHEGLAAYTVGQRRRLGVTGAKPQYVVRLDAERNVLVVGDGEELMERELTCTLGWMDGSVPGDLEGVTAQIRYRHNAAAVKRLEVEDGASARVEFEEPQRAICPGQTIAFYRGDLVVGSGVIDHAGCA